jgi:hypothetical protein
MSSCCPQASCRQYVCAHASVGSSNNVILGVYKVHSHLIEHLQYGESVTLNEYFIHSILNVKLREFTDVHAH